MIKNPIDLDSIKKKLLKSCRPADWLEEEAKMAKSRRKDVDGEQDAAVGVNMEPYTCIEDFRADIKLMFDNARFYNKTNTIYYKYACQLDQIVAPMLKRLRNVPVVASQMPS